MKNSGSLINGIYLNIQIVDFREKISVINISL